MAWCAKPGEDGRMEQSPSTAQLWVVGGYASEQRYLPACSSEEGRGAFGQVYTPAWPRGKEYVVQSVPQVLGPLLE